VNKNADFFFWHLGIFFPCASEKEMRETPKPSVFGSSEALFCVPHSTDLHWERVPKKKKIGPCAKSGL
jgi:hypothetical protein